MKSMRTSLFIFLFLLSHLLMVGQGIVRPFEDLEDYRVVTSPYRSSVDVMETDAEGNVWIAGEFERVLNVMRLNDIRYTLTASSGNYLYLMKLDPNLEVLWAKRIRYNGWEGLAARRIRFDKDGNAILQGKYNNYLRFDDGEILGDPRGVEGRAIYFAKITPEGEWIDKWEIRAPWISYCGDFRQLEDGTWRIAVLQAKLALILPHDTIRGIDSPARPGIRQNFDLVLDAQKRLVNVEFIYAGQGMTIVNNGKALVTPDGNIWHYIFISENMLQDTIQGEFWVGSQVFNGAGYKILEFSREGEFKQLSKAAKVDGLNYTRNMAWEGNRIYISGFEDLNPRLQINEIGPFGRKEHILRVYASSLGSQISDIHYVGDNELWIAGWFVGELKGEGWSSGYFVDWGYQPKQGFLISFDLSENQLKWVRTEPLPSDKNEIKNLSISSNYYFLHTTWGSDTINFDTLGLNDIFFAPKELICKFRMPEVGNYSGEVSPISAWPNPADEGIWIDLGEMRHEGESWELLDIRGRRLKGGVVGNQRYLFWDVSTTADGIYIFRLQSEDSPNIRVLVQH